MATLVFVVGPSGKGKSTSGRTLDPKSNLWINCDQKDLPVKGWKSKYNKESKNYAKTSDAAAIVKLLRGIREHNPKIDTVVIDTLNRVMTDKVMGDRKIKGFEKWGNLSGDIYEIIRTINNHMPEDMMVFVLSHSEEGFDDDGVQFRRIAVQGKQLEKFALESMSTIVLFTNVESKGKGDNTYSFETQTDGSSTAKSPPEMFEDYLIPNDLEAVRKAVVAYQEG